MATSSRGILTALPSSPHTITPYSTCSAGMKTGPNKDSCFRLRRCSDMHDAQKLPICYSPNFVIYDPLSLMNPTVCLCHHVCRCIVILVSCFFLPIYTRFVLQFWGQSTNVVFHFALFGVILIWPLCICPLIFSMWILSSTNAITKHVSVKLWAILCS